MYFFFFEYVRNQKNPSTLYYFLERSHNFFFESIACKTNSSIFATRKVGINLIKHHCYVRNRRDSRATI